MTVDNDRVKRTTHIEVRTDDDALSLDTLDQIVGGGEGTPQNTEQQQPVPPHEEHTSHEQTAAAATVHAPDHLQQPLADIEAHVHTAHDLTGDQAVTQIAALVGQNDHGLQANAGAEIASLIARGDVSAGVAMTDIHNAVTSHLLTGEQAVGLLAGIMVAQYTTPGEDASIGTAARTELAALVAANQVTPDHAVTALAAAAANVPESAQSSILSSVSDLAIQYGLSAQQIVADVGDAIHTYDLTGEQAVDVLVTVAATSWLAGMTQAVGAEIATLVTNHQVTVAEAIACLHETANSGWLMTNQVVEIIAAAGQANEELLAPGGTEIARLIGPNSWGFNTAVSQIGQLVNAHTLSVDHAVELLMGMAGTGMESLIANQFGSFLANRLITAAQIMTDIHEGIASHSVSGAQAVDLLVALAVSGGYGGSFATAANAEIVALIRGGEVTAAEVVAELSPGMASAAQYLNYGSSYQFALSQRLGILMQVAASGVDGAADAAGAALAGVLAQQSDPSVVATVVGMLGVQGRDVAAADAIAVQIGHLIEAHVITAQDAVTALATTCSTTSMAPTKSVVHEIAQLVAHGYLSASQAMDGIAALAMTGNTYSAINMMAFAAAESPALLAAAADHISSLITDYYPAAYATWPIHAAVVYGGMPADAAVALFAALIGDGTRPMTAVAAGAELAAMINDRSLTVTQTITGLHAAVVSHALGADAALALLTNASAAGNAELKIAVNNELTALIAGGLVSGEHAVEVLTALSVGASSALQAVINAALAVASAGDPVDAILSGLVATATQGQLGEAADHIYDLIHAGRISVATAMHDIHSALTSGELTSSQAMTLLLEIGSHADVAVQSAAGAEIGAVVAATNMTWTDLRDQFASHLPRLYTNVALTLSGEAIATMLAAAIGSSDTTSAARTAAGQALSSLINGDYRGIPNQSDWFTPIAANSLKTAVSSLLTAHALTGAEAIRVLFVTGDSRYWTASANIADLMNSGAVSMADVHTAATAGWWQIDAAVRALSSLNNDGAANEIVALVTAGAINADRVLSDIRPGWNVDPAQNQNPDAFLRVLTALASTGEAGYVSTISLELVGLIAHRQISADQLSAVLQHAGTHQGDIVGQMLGQISGLLPTNGGPIWAAHAAAAMVNAHIATMGEVMTALMTSIGDNAAAFRAISDIINYAVAFGELTPAQAVHGVVEAAAADTMSEDQAVALLATLAANRSNLQDAVAQALVEMVANHSISGVRMLDDLVTMNTTAINAAQLIGLLARMDAADTGGLIHSYIPNYIFLAAAYRGSSMDGAISILAGLATDPAFMPTAAAAINTMVASGRIDAAAAIADVYNGLGFGEPSLGLLACMAARGTAEMRAAVFGDFTMRVTVGISTPDAIMGAMLREMGSAIAVLQGAMDGASRIATLQSAVGAEFAALIGTTRISAPDAVAAIHAAVVDAHSLPANQATALLAGMLTVDSYPLRNAVVQELTALVTAGQITTDQALTAIDAAVNSGAMPVSTAMSALGTFGAAGPAFAAAAGGEIGLLIYHGKLSADDAVQILHHAMVNGFSTPETVIGIYSGMAAHWSATNFGTLPAVGAEVARIVTAGYPSAAQVIAAIDHSVTDGSVPAAKAIAFLSNIVKAGAPGFEDGAVNEIVSLIATRNVAASDVVQAVGFVLGPQSPYGATVFAQVAARGTPELLAAYGAFVVTGAQLNNLDPGQAIASIHDALSAGHLTGEQTLLLLANIAATHGVNSPASGGLPAAIHAELMSLISQRAVSDTRVIEVLQSLIPGDQSQGALAQEIANLVADPKIFIDAAVQLGGGMDDAGAKLAAMINAGKIDLSNAMQSIEQAVGRHSMTADQAVAFIASIVGHGTSNGWSIVNPETQDINWLGYAARTMTDLVRTYGLTIEGLMTDITAAADANLLNGGQTVLLLAAMAGNPFAVAGLDKAVASEIATLVAGGEVRADAAILAIKTTTRADWTDAGVLSADQAVHLLASLGAAADITPALLTEAGHALADLVPQFVRPIDFKSAIDTMIANGQLTGAQALSILTPAAAVGSVGLEAAIGQIFGGLIASGAVSMADLHAQIASSGMYNYPATVLLASIGSPAALAELAALPGQTPYSIYGAIQQAMAHSDANSGLRPIQAVDALMLLPPEMAALVAAEIAVYNSRFDVTGMYNEILTIGMSGADGSRQTAVRVIDQLFVGTNAYSSLLYMINQLVPGSASADSAVGLYATLSASYNNQMDFAARYGILDLISSGKIPATQAIADIHNALSGHTVDQTVALLAGLAQSATVQGSSNASGGLVMSAVVAELTALISNGQITTADFLADIARASMTGVSSAGQYNDAMQSGGLSTIGMVSLLASIAASSTDSGLQAIAGQQIAAMVRSYSISATDLTADIQTLVSTHVLSGDQGLLALANIPTADAALKTAVGDAMALLVSNGSITADQALSVLVDLASSGSTVQQAAAGNALAELVAHGQLTAAQAVAGIHSAVAGQSLAAAEAVVLLTGLASNEAQGLQAAAAAEIVQLVSTGLVQGTQALALIVGAAGTGTTALQAAAGDVMAALVSAHSVTADQAVSAVSGAIWHGLTEMQAMLVFVNMAGSGEPSLQTAVSAAMAAAAASSADPTSFLQGIVASVGTHALTADQAVLVLAAIAAGAIPNIQIVAGTQINALIAAGHITGPQVVTDIHNAAVAHSLGGAQAAIALAHIWETARDSDTRMAVFAELPRLVADGALTADQALAVMISVADQGSLGARSVAGAMLAPLLDSGLITAAQLSDAIVTRFASGNGALTSAEVTGMMIGIAGSTQHSATQAAAGEAIAALIRGHWMNVYEMSDVVTAAIDGNVNAPRSAIALLLNVAAAAPNEPYAELGIAGIIANLTDHALVPGVFGMMMGFAADGPPAMFNAVAAALGAMTATPGHSNQSLAHIPLNIYTGVMDFVTAGRMTIDQAIEFSAHLTSANRGSDWWVTQMILDGNVSADHAVQVLATLASHADGNLLSAIQSEINNLLIGEPVRSTVTAAQVMDGIGHAVASGAISGDFAIPLIMRVASTMHGNAINEAAREIALLVTDHRIDADRAMWLAASITGNDTSIVMALLSVAPDAAVQNAASRMLGSIMDTHPAVIISSLEDAVRNHVMTADQMIAAMLHAVDVRGSATINDAVRNEIVSMVQNRMIGVDQAITDIVRASGNFGFIGSEIAALIAANLITADHAQDVIVAAATSDGGVNADQAIGIMVSLSSTNRALDHAISLEIIDLINSGKITAAHAMADIANSPAVAAHLLQQFVTAGVNTADAAAIQMAALITQGAVNEYYLKTFASELGEKNGLGWLVSVAFHGSDALKQSIDSLLVDLSRGSTRNYGFHAFSDDAVYWLGQFSAQATPGVQYWIGHEIGVVLATAYAGYYDIVKAATDLVKGMVTGTPPYIPASISVETAVLIGLGMSHSSVSADMHTVGDRIVGSYNTFDYAKVLPGIAAAFPVDEAMSMFTDIYTKMPNSHVAIGDQIATMVADGRASPTQVMADIAGMTAANQLTLVTCILLADKAPAGPFAEVFANMTLQTMGVASASPLYTSMHDALIHMTADMAGLGKGTMPAATAISDLKQYAADHQLPPDALIAVLWQSMHAKDYGSLMFEKTAYMVALSNELAPHIRTMTTMNDVAHLVANGSLTAGAGDWLMTTIAAAAFNHLNFGNVDYDLGRQAALDIMRVQVVVEQDTPRLLNGTLSGADALAHLQTAAGSNIFARDQGLAELAAALADRMDDNGGAMRAALTPAYDALTAVLGGDITLGTAENAISQMTGRGWLTPAQALTHLDTLVSAVTVGLSADAAENIQAMAYARLALASGGYYPVTNGVGALLNYLEADTNRLLLIAEGCGSLQHIDQNNPAAIAAGLHLAQAVMQIYIERQPPEPTPTNDSDFQRAVNKFNEYAEKVGEAFSKGYTAAAGVWSKVEDKNNIARILGREVAPDPASVKAWLDLGVEIGTTGIPGTGLAGVPSLQSIMLNEAFGAGAGAGFTAVNLGSMVMVQVLSMGAVANAMEAKGMGGFHDGLLTSFRLISASCALITNTLSGVVHAAVDMYWDVGKSMGNVFEDIYHGRVDERHMHEFGDTIFKLAFMVDRGAAQDWGEDMGAVFVDLFSGNPANISDDAKKLGLDTLKLIASNPYLQVAGRTIGAYGKEIDDALGLSNNTLGIAMTLGFFF